MEYNRPLLNAIPLCRTRGSTLLSLANLSGNCTYVHARKWIFRTVQHQQGQFFKQFHPLASLLKNEDPTKITTGTTCQGLRGELPTEYWNKRWAHLKTQLQMWGWMLENLTRISFENLVLCWNICHWNGNQTIIYVQFYHLHILISLDSFKQLWECIFFKRNGCISKGNPRSDVQAFTFPMDFWKSARGYCWAPSGLLMRHVECLGAFPTPTMPNHPPCGDEWQSCAKAHQGHSQLPWAPSWKETDACLVLRRSDCRGSRRD